MHEEADDFEYQACEFVQQILALMGIEDTPVFKRNRISNEKEQVEMVMMEADYFDDETVLSKLPNVTPDEVAHILARKDMETAERFEMEGMEEAGGEVDTTEIDNSMMEEYSNDVISMLEGILEE